MEDTKITLGELRSYFKDRGADLDELFDPNKYSRYTEKNAKLINQAIEHYTEWKVNPDGGLHFVHPDYPDGVLRHARIGNVNDISSLKQYHKEINELSDTEYFLDMVENVIDQAETIELQEQVDEYLREHHNMNLDELLQSENGKERSKQLNEVFHEFADSHINDGNVEFIDPLGKKHPFLKSGRFKLSKLDDVNQVSKILKEVKSMRDLHFGVRSDHVRKGYGISKRQMDRLMGKWSRESVEEVIGRTNSIDEAGRTERLEALHFMLSEVGRDKDGDMAFPHPDGSSRRIVVSGLEGKDRYYEDIKTLQEFIDKVKYAREHRDTYYQAYENAKEDIESRQDKLKKKGKDKEELER